MKFKYLKLTLLLASIASASMTVQANVDALQADADAAALLMAKLLHVNGPQRELPQTLAEIDKAIEKLNGHEKYQKICAALHKAKDTLVEFNVAQAKGIFSSVASELEEMRATLSPNVAQEVESCISQLKQMTMLQGAKLLNKLGVKLSWGKK